MNPYTIYNERLSTAEILDKLHSLTYTQSTPYKFPKNHKHLSSKQIEGALAVFEWFDNLIFDAYQEEKSIIHKLQQTIEHKRDNIKADLDEEYKKGVIEALNIIFADFENSKS